MKISILIIFFLLCKVGKAQSALDSLIQNDFEIAEKYTSDTLYIKAINKYQFIIKNYKLDNESWGDACLKIGELYEYLGEEQNAIIWYRKLIKSVRIIKSKNKKIIKEWLPFQKHFASCNLASIALRQKKYKAAMYYINLFEYKYPYKHFDDSRNEDYLYFRKEMHAKVYAGQGDTLKAIKTLVPYIYSNNNFDLLDLFFLLVKKKYSRELRLNEYYTATQNYKSKPYKVGAKIQNDIFINYYGVKVYVPYMDLNFPKSENMDTLTMKIFLKINDIPENYENLPIEKYKILSLTHCDFFERLKN